MIPFPEPEPGRPVRISATLMTTYERCPGEAEGRLAGIYGEDSIASFTGALMHRVIRRHLEDGPIPSEEIPHACRVEIGSGNLNTKMNAVGLRSSSQLEPIFLEIASKYERFQTYPDTGFDSAELHVEVDPAEDVTLVGKIDAVFIEGDTVRLVDWKTGGLGNPRAQLGFYALIWAYANERLPHEIEVVSLGTGERHTEPVTTEWLSEVAQQVSTLATIIRRHLDTGAALALSPGPWCRYCPLNQDCDEGKTALALLDGGIGGIREENV